MPVADPRRVSSAGLAALLAHEGMPGHHLETGIKLENKVPEFRRRLWINAFGEGWALYAESLGHELGLYDQPLDLLGRYSVELFRAGRLVVDTGLHAKGWTRAQAIQYLVEECGRAKAARPTRCCATWSGPGRRSATRSASSRSSIARQGAEAPRRAVGPPRLPRRGLAEGHLPISMLRQRIDAWIDAQLTK